MINHMNRYAGLYCNDIEVQIKSCTITILGDKGKNLEGLRKIYYNPKFYKILPFRHNYTQTGEYATTSFFIPYFAQSLNPDYMDERGVCKEELFKKQL